LVDKALDPLGLLPREGPMRVGMPRAVVAEVVDIDPPRIILAGVRRNRVT
jgi:hypothetical protein